MSHIVARSLGMLLGVGAMPLFLACAEAGDPTETRYFRGNVYDGVTGSKLSDYHIDIEYYGTRKSGVVRADGSFELPGVPAFHDYSVYIDAPSYRSLVAHEAQFDPCRVASEEGCRVMVKGDSSFRYDAFLFSDKLQVEDVPVTVALRDAYEKPSGAIRLTPTAKSRAYNPIAQSAIDSQVWTNDNDLLEHTVWVDFVGGAATLPGDKLVYGVAYEVTVLNVPGYQLTKIDEPFVAGASGRQAYTLSRLSTTPLRVAFKSTDLPKPSTHGEFVVVFNQPVGLDSRYSERAYAAHIDQSFKIESEDADDDGNRNVLPPSGADGKGRGTKLSLEGSSLTLDWTKTLESTDEDDPIRSVTWGGLDEIRLIPKNGAAADGASLGTLLGTDAINVPVGGH